jgi:hypothetical protein
VGCTYDKNNKISVQTAHGKETHRGIILRLKQRAEEDSEDEYVDAVQFRKMEAKAAAEELVRVREAALVQQASAIQLRPPR